MAYNTVKIKKYSDVIEEAVANATITPGMLVELMSTGKVKAHATAEGDATPIMFALEDELQGKGLDDNYIATDPVQVWIPYRGDWVYAILADGENIAIGDKLASAGDGTLKKHVTEAESWEVSEAGVVHVYPNQIVAIAREAVDLSGSSGEETNDSTIGFNHRIAVQIV